MKLNVKQILNLTAAIGAILFAVLLMIGLVQSLVGLVDELRWSISNVGDFVLRVVYLSAIIVTIVFLIINGVKICRNKSEKNTIIMLLAFYVAGLLLSVLGAGFSDELGALAAFEILFAIVGLGLLITGLSLSAYASAGVSKPDAKRDKIDFLKQLQEEGTITQEDYKKLVLKELE